MDDSLDLEIQATLEAAVDYCERVTGTSLRVGTVRVDSYACWPCSPVRFTVQPVKTVDSVYYYDQDDTDTAVTSTNYRLVQSTLGAAFLEWDDDYSKPSHSTRSDAIRITYTSGYAAVSNVPPVAIHAIKLMLSAFWADDDPSAFHLLSEKSKKAADNMLAAIDWGVYR